jgi:large subunit ribosomal protein L7/L12
MSTTKITEIVDQVSKMTLLEVSDLVKALETKFGVSAAPVAVASAAPAAQESKAEEKTEFKITLKDSGADKIKVIKALRSVAPTLTLKDAKDMVENVPAVIAEASAKDDAKKIKEALEAAGAKVDLS